MKPPLFLRFAFRELRGGLHGFRIFLACLALGVAAIAGVGSVASSVVAGLRADAKVLLGGDVELRLVHRTADAAQRAHFAASAQSSEVAVMRAMARRPDGEQRSLIEMKAVDGAYPLYGALRLAPELSAQDALGERGGVWGAVVDPVLLERLHAKLGDRVRIGDAELELRATIAREPDVGGGFIFGPRVIIALDALPSTGLVQPASLIAYEYRLRFPQETDIDAWVTDLKQRWPDAGWRIREFGEAAPRVREFLDRLALFLTLVGLTALLVGGVGVGNAVRGYLQSRIATIATLKCLGAPGRLVFATYLAQILLIAALGILVGLAVGAAAPLVAAHFLAERLPIEARLGIYPAPLLLAAAFGVLTTLAFSLWPLGRAREVPAASLFRDLVAPALGRPRPSIIAGTAFAALALAALAIGSAGDRRVAGWFVLGAVATLIAFRLAAAGVMALARRVGRPRFPGLRLALANLHRPGAPTPSVVLSLGLGLTVLVAIALIERNLLAEVEERLPENAPSYFFIDIQPDQVAEFDRIMKEDGVIAAERVPSLRGRNTRLDGVPVERAEVASEARWAVRSERGLT
jgi:putative ABC transport system permease protein